MNSSAFRPRLLAAAVSLCFAAPLAHAEEADVAQAGQALSSITVTGARFDADPSLTPIGAIIISADEIRRSGASDVNAAIRKVGGVYGRQSLDGSPDFGLDLRGFGTNSSQNLVIVLDGVRLSENELGNAILSTIPVDTVDRIEITRGGASVLYGGGATGGVINIVTKRPQANTSRASMFVEGGQFHAGEVRLSGAQAWDNFAADATLDTQRTDNYRDNNEFKQTQFSGGAQWFANQFDRVGFRYEGARQDMQFAGALSEAQFNANPRQTLTPNDNGSLDSDRLTVFGQHRLYGHDLAADLSYRKKTVESMYVSSFGVSTGRYESKQWQFSPRVRKLGAINGMVNELVAGFDFTKWDRTTDAASGGFAYSAADAEQKSKALYVRDELRFDPVHEGRISAGVRREIFDKDYADPLASAAYDAKQALNAWELQASYMPVTNVTVFGKLGQSFRVATSDEDSYTPVFNKPLAAQQSHDAELGLSYADAVRKITARVFRHNLTNEIFFDPTANVYGANTNLDPTRRQGFELDAEHKLNAAWAVNAHYQHVQAKFREGVNDGKEMVLVPKNTLSARLAWTGASQTADVGVQWTDKQRYGSDFANDCSGQMPSYTTLDARYARTFGQWEWAVSGQNLTDKNYYSQAFSCKGGIYPSNGRQLKLSARYEF
ncbi:MULTISPECIES: TonB-dependent receptor [unclassified Duganella]|uniref:TonB-dependent receptor family protein n=1 Tax=unclassified Duganella TaxID=2636909 RepID=UPI00088DE70B|nr:MULTISPECIES: TonB-dependent receptor [unclassified Duganella]SDH33908.1 iron complex outermembrane recepter protein [Duganella sp. OV458]SDK50522.1 iron complex outermembrane recepter protein [Duganella sp. OV510]